MLRLDKYERYLVFHSIVFHESLVLNGMGISLLSFRRSLEAVGKGLM